MAVPKLIYSQLRRSRTFSGFLSLSPARVSPLLPCGDAGRYSTPSQPPIPPYRPPRAFPAPNSHSVCRHLHHRNFSTRPDESSQFTDDHITASTSEPELADFGLDDAKGVVLTDVVSSGEESILPVRALISLLDGYHDVTGLPWWIVIASATLVMRLALFPLLVLQLKKLKTISEFFPKLPPPIPPPLSGRSYVDQISLFRRERKAAGCPSYLWFLASISVQIPCFLLAVTSIRRMSLDHHPGFECGGALWFQNLTEFPHGPLGSIFPILISGLHFLNVQLAFENSSVRKMSGPLGLLAKYYKHYLDFLVLPLLYIGYCIPQSRSSVALSLSQSFAIMATSETDDFDEPPMLSSCKSILSYSKSPTNSPLFPVQEIRDHSGAAANEFVNGI
ncbi:unnamed protein product [Linum tenue]|uniref:Uncharacterized protein n=1 Tax=Linum tenue TaxID=586396 RepID=A0AAV0MNX6_9ROSI|nr:unnamed protein product [Linum tenue]